MCYGNQNKTLMVLKRMKNLRLFRCLNPSPYIYVLKRIFCSILFQKSFQSASQLHIFSANGGAQLSCPIREMSV